MRNSLEPRYLFRQEAVEVLGSTTTRLWSIMRLSLFGALLSIVSGCGLNMQQHYANYRPYLLTRDYDAAVDYVEGKKESFYGEKNRLLYYLDRATIMHLAGRYQESNQILEQAKTAAEELWTESVAENALSWVTTDNSLSYAGEDYEKVLIHFTAATNYLSLGDHSAARVEARQITNALQLYNQRYEELATQKSFYKDDAFARWLAGKLAETEGGFSALNDAWIDYQKALAVYQEDYKRYQTPLPQQLVADALRVLAGLGADFAAELEELRAQFPTVQVVPQPEAVTKGRLVLLHSAGEAPYKIDDFWDHEDGGNSVRIAFPRLVAKPHRVDRARLVVGSERAPAELAEDVTAIAIQNLADHMERIRAKAIARAMLKYAVGTAAQVAGQAAGGRGGRLAQLAGAAWNLGHRIAEEADKRCWVTLPSRINLSQLLVEPGTVEVIIEYLSAAGTPLGSLSEKRKVSVKAGETVFLFARTFD